MFGLNGRQIFILLVLVALLFAGAQYVPAYFAAFQFNDFVRQEVKFAVTNRKNTDALRIDVAQRASELGIAIKAKDVRIVRRGPAFTLEVDYRWPINMKVYQQELMFHVSESGEIFENASD